MNEKALNLGEPADESDWRALAELGLKGAPWERLIAHTGDGVAIAPLYREPDFPTATDVSGFPGAAPFIRGGAGWAIRQAFEHPNPTQTNHDILTDLQGGVGAIELVIDPVHDLGVAIRDGADLDLALADVILEAAPVSLDAGAYGLWAAELLKTKLKGVAAAGIAFNIDPLGALMRTGAMGRDAVREAASFAARARQTMPAATALRVDARPTHEAGGTQAQEIAAALACGIHYLRALSEAGLDIDESGKALAFTLSVGPDVLIEAAKLRALRLCWARVLQASGAAPEARGARIHGVTSRRMMTRYDAHANILRVTVAAFAATIGGAEAITTLPFTDALGPPTPFARRLARNTQHVLKEEAHLGAVADPAGGAWFVEKMTRDLAAKAWEIMQRIEASGGILAALTSGALQQGIAEARTARLHAFATRRCTITGVTDYPLLGAPEVEHMDRRRLAGEDAGGMPAIRWAEPFERLRDRVSSPVHGGGVERSETEGGRPSNAGASPLSHRASRVDSSPASGGAKRPYVFFATLGPLIEFAARAQFAQNLFAAGGVGAIEPEAEYASRAAMLAAFKQSGASVAVLVGADARYAAEAEAAARALKQAGAAWLILAGKPREDEAKLRAAGVDQFVFAGQDALAELETLHAALGLTP